MSATAPVATATRRDEALSRHRYVNYREASELLGLSEVTLRRLVKRGDGPTPVRLSERRLAFALAELEAWTAARRVPVSREHGR